ncbi:MAG: type VI secretion system baseplate subunit TssG, partial [Proteobacteria bacterium]|nr:type VI secretion system baseplate subunit TssG [Candidatus Avisuccinivibrio stercorigallinarum]
MDQLKKLLNKTAAELQRGRDPDFFELLRRIGQLAVDKPPPGCARSPRDEPVRLGQMPHLNFPKTQLAALTESREHPELPLILVYFMGLAGVNGPLPLELTALICQRSVNYYDHSLRRFLDLIHHRLLLLFYRAFAHNELPVSFDRPAEDKIGRIVDALCGLKPKLPELSLNQMRSGVQFLMRPERSAQGLQLLLQQFFALPFAVTQFAGSRSLVPPEYR